MREMTSKFTKKDLEQIGDYLAERYPVLKSGTPPWRYSDIDLDIRERVVRVEEELKNQRELMQQGFSLMEKRFEQVDKRFDEMRTDMIARFEQVDKRFEQVDKRSDEMRIDMNTRFEQVDKRFDEFNTRFRMMFTFMFLGFTVLAFMMTAFKFIS